MIRKKPLSVQNGKARCPWEGLPMCARTWKRRNAISPLRATSALPSGKIYGVTGRSKSFLRPGTATIRSWRRRLRLSATFLSWNVNLPPFSMKNIKFAIMHRPNFYVSAAGLRSLNGRRNDISTLFWLIKNIRNISRIHLLRFVITAALFLLNKNTGTPFPALSMICPPAARPFM